jgi:hypothetical protein
MLTLSFSGQMVVQHFAILTIAAENPDEHDFGFEQYPCFSFDDLDLTNMLRISGVEVEQCTLGDLELNSAFTISGIEVEQGMTVANLEAS